MFEDLPPIDHDRFWDAYTIRYGWSEENATPEGQREIYFTEALDDGFKIRELQAKKRLDDKDRRKLEWLLHSFPAYLDEAETFFGTENSEALRGLLKQHTGFEFNDDYELLEENEMARAKVQKEGPTIDTSKMSEEEFKETLDHVVPEEKETTFRLASFFFKKEGPIDECVDPSAILSGKPVKAFTFCGERYVLSGSASNPKEKYLSRATGWKIVPLDEFKGKLANESNNVTGYHGVKVRVQDDDNGADRADFVMISPSVTFVPKVVDARTPEPDPVPQTGVALSITKEEFYKFNEAYEPSALNHDDDGTKKNPKPIESEIIEFEEKHYLIIGATYSMGGKYGEPKQSLSAHEVVLESEYKGPTTRPSEWEVRGLGKHAGTKLLGKDGNLWVVTDDDGVELVQNEPSYFQDNEASEPGTTVYRVSIKDLEALRDSYSGETLDKGKIKKPFQLEEGSLYICSSFVNFTPDGTVSAYHVTPAEEAESWREEYKQEKKEAGHLIEAKHGRNKYVLTGPPVEFRAFKSQLAALNIPEPAPESNSVVSESDVDDDIPHSEIPIPQSDGPRDSRSIPLDQLIVSDFEPQKRRRARFVEEETAELAADIKANRLMHAIVVRPFGDKFQIVVGERRYLAVKHLGWPEIDATVRELTDEQAFDLQYSENSKRKDIHPLDEAYNFKCLQDRFNYDLEGVALHTGHKPAHIAGRLKLITLHPLVQEAFEKGDILFGHALEISRYRKEDHEQLLEYAWVERYGEKGTVTLPVLRERIDQGYLRRLDKAPFSIKSEDLRDDKLTCVSCPDRTGANPTLFADLSDDDRCLNPECWSAKVNTFVKIQRIKTALGKFDPDRSYTKTEEKKVKDVVMISDGYVNAADAPEKYLIKYNVTELKKKDECDKFETGLIFNGDKIGQQIRFCRDTSCKVHNRSGSPKADKTEDPNERLRRKEELIDIHVAESVRRKVLVQASEAFAGEFLMSGENDLLVRIVAQLWDTADGNPYSLAKRTIVESVLDEKVNIHANGWDFENKVKTLSELSEHKLKQLLFLFANGLKGEMYNEKYKSQASVREIAENYEIDYQLLDAEIRLAFVQEKHQKHEDAFKKYLDDVRACKAAPIPRPYFPDYVTPEN